MFAFYAIMAVIIIRGMLEMTAYSFVIMRGV